jgi:hypothetical protein
MPIDEAHETLKELCDILRQVHKLSYAAWKDGKNLNDEKVDPKTYDTYIALISKNPWVEPQTFESQLRSAETSRSSQVTFRIEKGNFYLPPLEEDAGFVPSIFLECNLTSNKIGVRIEMYTIQGESLRGIGYRLEVGDKTHAYCHLSLANRRPDSLGGQLLDGCPEWLPTTIPRAPAMGRNIVCLITCIIIGLYGHKGLLSRIQIDGKYLGEIDHIMKLGRVA